MTDVTAQIAMLMISMVYLVVATVYLIVSIRFWRDVQKLTKGKKND